MSPHLQFHLPDPLAQWPWPRMLNEHYTQVKPESDEWLRSFEAFDIQSQKAFDSCDFGQLVICFQV
jgi:Delta6-protoilludene synthase